MRAANQTNRYPTMIQLYNCILLILPTEEI